MQVFDLEQPVPAAERGRPDGSTDRVVERVTQNRRGRQQHETQWRAQGAARIDRGERADGEQQGVAWQEGRYDESGLAKDDREQNRVDPGVVLGEQIDEMLVEMQDDINEPRNQATHPSGHMDLTSMCAL